MVRGNTPRRLSSFTSCSGRGAGERFDADEELLDGGKPRLLLISRYSKRICNSIDTITVGKQTFLWKASSGRETD
jgi:hypothetical protein